MLMTSFQPTPGQTVVSDNNVNDDVTGSGNKGGSNDVVVFQVRFSLCRRKK